MPSKNRGAWGVVLVATFLASRALNVWFWRIPEVNFVQNDVSYYGYWLWCLFGDGIANPECSAALSGPGVMTEYPLPAVWFLQGLYTLGVPLPLWLLITLIVLLTLALVTGSLLHARGRSLWSAVGFGAPIVVGLVLWFLVAMPQRAHAYATWLPVFALAMLALDAVVAMAMFVHGSVRACLFWILYIGACGPIVWFRFDMLTAAAVALACLYLVRHPHLSGALVGLGAGIKLWPALLIFPMAAPNPLKPGSGRARVIGFAVAGFGLGLASLLIGGWDRSVSPLQWQSKRGLQMESVPATPIQVLRTWTNDPSWRMGLSEYNAIELFGPATENLLRVSTVLTVASIVLTLLLAWRTLKLRSSELLPQAILLSVLTIVLMTIIANKTLSTQYVQWLAGPLAALMALPTKPWLKRPLFVTAVAFLVVAILTQYTYPWATLGIMGVPNGGGLETASLVGRNLLLVALTGFVGGLAWRATSRTQTTTGA